MTNYVLDEKEYIQLIDENEFLQKAIAKLIRQFGLQPVIGVEIDGKKLVIEDNATGPRLKVVHNDTAVIEMAG